MPRTAQPQRTTAQRDRYVERLVQRGSDVSIPEFRDRSVPGALYRVANRCGLGVLAVPDGALDARRRDALERFRFAQYLAAGFIDPDIAFREGLDHDALDRSSVRRLADTVHFVVFAAGSGRLLATMCLLAAEAGAPGVRMRERHRPLFPLEEHFGWGPFNRLALVPDTPLERVREFGRMVKNRRGGALGTGPRPAVELCLAATRVLVGPLSMAVDVCIGEFETRGVRRNLEYFHTPMVVLDGGLPVFAAGHPLNAALEGRDRYPFAFLVSDLASMASRLDAIEAALWKPDPDGLVALAELQRVPSQARSCLVPPGGLPVLANTALPQATMSLPARRRARENGRALSRFRPLAGLSETERTTLRTLMEVEEIDPGGTILARGEVARRLLLVDEGVAEVRRVPATAAGPGEVVGAAGVLAGIASPADVVARTRVRLLTLPGDAYRAAVRELPDVDLALHRLALGELGP
jgi:Cyclic nucleotide-binding domain